MAEMLVPPSDRIAETVGSRRCADEIKQYFCVMSALQPEVDSKSLKRHFRWAWNRSAVPILRQPSQTLGILGAVNLGCVDSDSVA